MRQQHPGGIKNGEAKFWRALFVNAAAPSKGCWNGRVVPPLSAGQRLSPPATLRTVPRTTLPLSNLHGGGRTAHTAGHRRLTFSSRRNRQRIILSEPVRFEFMEFWSLIVFGSIMGITFKLARDDRIEAGGRLSWLAIIIRSTAFGIGGGLVGTLLGGSLILETVGASALAYFVGSVSSE